jgi:phosphoribosylaminoimidazolecarboxamide formyltransferase/IMP cyclohydrolase
VTHSNDEAAMTNRPRRALLSVSDRTGLEELARALLHHGFTLVSSGGTAAHLKSCGLQVRAVEQVTGFPEILDGRVKTLHPHIHGGILARLDCAHHLAQLAERGIEPFTLVVVNLYPFRQQLSRPDASWPDTCEQIDIGGPTLVRASAKNFAHVTILTDPADYQGYAASLPEGGPDLSWRLAMARKAFQHTFEYDLLIAETLERLQVVDGLPSLQPAEPLPQRLRIASGTAQPLRYGENPHQTARFYPRQGAPALRQLQGKELSFNNLVDAESAWRCVQGFPSPAAVIVKHTNPCGIGLGSSPQQAFLRARRVDPVSAFGGVIALNAPLDGETARAIAEQFAELILAPDFLPEALELLREKKNLRLLIPPAELAAAATEIKCLANGWLVQETDLARVDSPAWRLVSRKQPDASQLAALDVAWKTVIHVKSNAIVYAQQDGALAIGAGQMSRVDSARIALWKASEAGLDVRGCAMASDAFFPFRDSVDAAAEAGVAAIVQPGGSIRDEEVIQAADQHGMVLFFTGQRHFKH